MKKRVAALCLALMLWACAACAASYTAKVDGGALFTLRYDDKSYQLDQYSYLNSSVNGTWFFILYDAQRSIDCGMEYTDRGAGMTLKNADPMALASYADAVCQAAGGTLVETYTVGNQPFVIVSARHPGTGLVYYAETIVGGNAVYFEVYNLRTGEAGDACLTALKDILTGFTPLQ